MLDAMTHWTRVQPVYSQKFSFQESQIVFLLDNACWAVGKKLQTNEPSIDNQ